MKHAWSSTMLLSAAMLVPAAQALGSGGHGHHGHHHGHFGHHGGHFGHHGGHFGHHGGHFGRHGGLFGHHGGLFGRHHGGFSIGFSIGRHHHYRPYTGYYSPYSYYYPSYASYPSYSYGNVYPSYRRYCSPYRDRYYDPWYSSARTAPDAGRYVSTTVERTSGLTRTTTPQPPARLSLPTPDVQPRQDDSIRPAVLQTTSNGDLTDPPDSRDVENPSQTSLGDGLGVQLQTPQARPLTSHDESPWIAK